VHPLVMGLEEHLLHMFREDFEFNNDAGASHHGGHKPASGPTEVLNVAGADAVATMKAAAAEAPAEAGAGDLIWLSDAENELKKIPFFVRGKARRNTEKYAAERGVTRIGIDTLYEAKAHYAR
jgi:light-independent protochlorophyllide reductase subunit B